MSDDAKGFVGYGLGGDIVGLDAISEMNRRQSASFQPKPVHIADWERRRQARFGSLNATAICTDEGMLTSLHVSGELRDREQLRALLGFLQELVK